MTNTDSIFNFEKQCYKAKYQDKFGIEDTKLWNDGEELSITLRGVKFISQFLDDFTPIKDIAPKKLEQFTFYSHTELCDFELEAEISMHIKINEQINPCTLTLILILGKPNPPRGLLKEEVLLKLSYQKESIHSVGTTGWFEGELLDLGTELPEDSYLLCCFNCLYSDYHPVGHGLFGGMLCFKRHKKEYLAVKTKDDFLDLDSETYDIVQELYICPEFKKRIPGTGYRG